MLGKDHFAYISLIEGMTKRVDERIGNMDEVLKTLLPLASKYIVEYYICWLSQYHIPV